MGPDGWSEVRLGDLFAEVVDRNNRERLPVLAVTLDRGVVRRESLDRKMDREVEQDAYLRALPGDIAYNTMRMWQGGSGLVREPGFVSPAYTVLRARGEECPEFWAHAFKAPGLIDSFRAFSQGVARDRHRLYYDQFSAVRTLRPPLAEQRKIAAILSAADETIEKTGAVIAQLDVVKKATLEELLTRGIGGRGLEPIAEEWRLGRVVPGITLKPAGWQLVRLTEVAKLESGHTPSRRHPEYWNGGVPWVSLHDTGALDGPVISETAQTVSELGIANSSARLLPRGTVVFSRTATVGKVTVLGREMSTSQDFANYVCGPRVHNRYLMHLLRFMQVEWARLMAGSTHQTIYMPVFRDLQILLPEVREQERIAEVADAVEARIQAERDSLVPMRAVKASLASELLSGTKRVQPAEAT